MNSTKTFAMILAMAAVSAPAAAFAQNYDNAHGGPHSDQGVITSINGSNIRLEDGRTIFLHNGTVINPRGTTLQPGQRISVTGERGGRGAINANEIDVQRGGHHDHHYDGDGDGDGNNDHGH